MEFIRKKPLAIAASLIAVAGAILITVNLWAAFEPISNGTNSERKLIAKTYDLYDLGVADINGDRRYDIFTVNHSNWQETLIGEEDGSYENRTLEMGLAHSFEFPAVEQGSTLPRRSADGLYIFWNRGRLMLECVGSRRAEGRVTLSRELGVETRGGASFSQETDGVFRFDLPRDSRVMLFSWDYYFTPRFEIEGGFPLGMVYIGPRCASPSQRTFSLPERDRHAMAWADYDGDGLVDVFIARGGDQGKLATTDPDADNELLVRMDSKFVDRTREVGFVKNGYPGRVAAWVDANADGLLDLFLGNGRVEQPKRDAPNQLFVQDSNGRFRDAAAGLGLDTPGQGVACWIDVNNDGFLDLVWANADTIRLFVNGSGQRFQEIVIGKIEMEPKQLTSCDYDGDGDVDVFLASKARNLLLVNSEGVLIAESAEAHGLPKASFGASWVDIDNDGLMELHTLPQGIFERVDESGFRSTGLFAVRKSPFISQRKVISTWYDYDNDGDRDLLVSFVNPFSSLRAMVGRPLRSRDVFRPLEWSVFLYPNHQSTGNNWLQVELSGPVGNRPAIGAQVKVFTKAGVLLGEVGAAEGSMQSQGHYRMYFGLGEVDRIDRLEVMWPSGERQVCDGIKGNRILEIRYDDWEKQSINDYNQT